MSKLFKLKSLLLCLKLACTPLLLALEDDEAVVIDSSTANYDGKQIVLSGDVVVEHVIGKIYANHIVLMPENTKKKMRFAYMKMNDDVKFHLKDGGQLHCAQADLDYLNLTGKFTGNVGQEYVVYTESCKTHESKSTPLVLKAREMSVLLTNIEGAENESQKNCISEITARQNVTVNYNHDFIAAADFAIYQRLKDAANLDEHKLPGTINLVAESQNGICQITNRNGDMIRAAKIDIDTLKRCLNFTIPRGTLLLKAKDNTTDRVFFESDHMTWDDANNLLTFLGNITISEKAYGQLHGDREVKLSYTEENGKKKIKSIISLGETSLAHIDDEKKLVHTLTSYGNVCVDHVSFKTSITSPLDLNNRVHEGMQVYFHDIYGEIYADKAFLDYEQVNGVLTLKKITLEGHVKILNRSSVNPEESEAFLQYALTDHVEFDPATNEMVMSSRKKSRVLFYDKVNNLQISAPGVKIKRDALTKQESIQGIGDARFSLVDHELEKLKNHFSLEPATVSR
jgi:lipopolysaccharide export system protein LptA